MHPDQPPEPSISTGCDSSASPDPGSRTPGRTGDSQAIRLLQGIDCLASTLGRMERRIDGVPLPVPRTEWSEVQQQLALLSAIVRSLDAYVAETVANLPPDTEPSAQELDQALRTRLRGILRSLLRINEWVRYWTKPQNGPTVRRLV